MSHQTIIYGYIEGRVWRKEDYRKYQARNIEIVSKLPDEDADPHFVNGIFASKMPNENTKQGTFKTHILHFGVSLKTRGLDQRDIWIAKFEELLRRLYWGTAIVHIDTEIYGSYKYEWRIKLEKIVSNYDVEELSPTTNWKRLVFSNGEVIESVDT